MTNETFDPDAWDRAFRLWPHEYQGAIRDRACRVCGELYGDKRHDVGDTTPTSARQDPLPAAEMAPDVDEESPDGA